MSHHRIPGVVGWFLIFACHDILAQGTAPYWGQVPVVLEVRLAALVARSDFRPATVFGTQDTVYLHSSVALSTRDLASAELLDDQPFPALRVKLTPEAATRLARLTAAHVGEYLAIVLNGVAIGAPPIIAGAVSSDPTLPVWISLPELPRDAVPRLRTAVLATWPPRPARQ